MTSVLFRSVSAGNTEIQIAENHKTVLVIGEKAQLETEGALQFLTSRLALPADFVAPIAAGTTETLTAYVGGKTVTVATFTEKRSRNLATVRVDAVQDVVSKSSGKEGDVLIIVKLAKDDQVFPAVLAIARAFPLYFNKLKPAPERTVTVDVTVPVELATPFDLAKLQNAANAVRDCAKLVDMPPNELNPTTYVDIVEQVWKEKLQPVGVKLEVIKGKDLKEKGYGGLWNVGKASEHPPALVILSHTPTAANKTVAWVGKGITFDTGGLSIKVGGVMSNMKTDMGGSGGVFQAFVATVLNGAASNLNLHALLCIAENSVDSTSYRVDDVITCYSGKTVEVFNTDAEGRLVLMDGVAHACKHLNPDVLIDMATLTGAQAYATGLKHAGFISNSAELEAIVCSAAKESGDLAFPMLYCPEFLGVEKVMASKVADMANIPPSAGDRTNAPSSASGMFVGAHLSPDDKWVEGGQGQWCHVDMAFPSNAGGRGTGYGVGLLYGIAQRLNSP